MMYKNFYNLNMAVVSLVHTFFTYHLILYLLAFLTLILMMIFY